MVNEGTKPLIYAISEALDQMARPEIDDEEDTEPTNSEDA